MTGTQGQCLDCGKTELWLRDLCVSSSVSRGEAAADVRRLLLETRAATMTTSQMSSSARRTRRASAGTTTARKTRRARRKIRKNAGGGGARRGSGDATFSRAAGDSTLEARIPQDRYRVIEGTFSYWVIERVF